MEIGVHQAGADDAPVQARVTGEEQAAVPHRQETTAVPDQVAQGGARAHVRTLYGPVVAVGAAQETLPAYGHEAGTAPGHALQLGGGPGELGDPVFPVGAGEDDTAGAHGDELAAVPEDVVQGLAGERVGVGGPVEAVGTGEHRPGTAHRHVAAVVTGQSPQNDADADVSRGPAQAVGTGEDGAGTACGDEMTQIIAPQDPFQSGAGARVHFDPGDAVVAGDHFAVGATGHVTIQRGAPGHVDEGDVGDSGRAKSPVVRIGTGGQQAVVTHHHVASAGMEDAVERVDHAQRVHLPVAAVAAGGDDPAAAYGIEAAAVPEDPPKIACIRQGIDRGPFGARRSGRFRIRRTQKAEGGEKQDGKEGRQAKHHGLLAGMCGNVHTLNIQTPRTAENSTKSAARARRGAGLSSGPCPDRGSAPPAGS